ncbi:MAG: hypothetical protein JXR58_07435 [Bacteroidales bacterium]|nr:hypothetical protein [Bacteroidales bacterium]
MKTTKILLVLAVIAFVFASCSKYEEGPSISLKSKKSRLAKEWKLVSLYDANGDEQSVVPDWENNYTKGGDYSTKVYGIEQNGTWEFDGDVNLKITYELSGGGATFKSYENYEIIRLASDELWLKDNNSGHVTTNGYELRFEPK